MSFRNKRILITAGPTWVALDRARVISNTATGQTGILLAEQLAGLGAKVTLLLGPATPCRLNKKVELIKFKFFDELKLLLENELKKRRYNVVIHSAAVSDYKPKNYRAQKIRSGIKDLTLKFIPTAKIIDCIKKLSPHTFLVGFKFEPECKREALLREARSLLRRSNSDLIVANTQYTDKYAAYIQSRDSAIGPLYSKESLADKLMNVLNNEL